MYRKGKLFATLAIILMFVYQIYHYFKFNNLNILDAVFSISIVLLTWVLGKKYDEIDLNYENIKQQNEQIENEIIKMNQSYSEYEEHFYSFDEAALFIYDAILDKYKFSIGVENIFGYSYDVFIENLEIWKSLILMEDVAEVKEAEVKFFKGNPVQNQFRITHPIEGEKWILRVAKPIKNSNGEIIKINGSFIDITEHKKVENELRQMAYFDDLTELPNRKMLDKHIQKALARSKRYNYNFTLMFLDLDDFKLVNDTLGHDAGDKLLQEVVTRLNECTREEDLIARIGGDEFILVFEETSKEEIEDIAKQIIEAVTPPFNIDGNEAKVSVSIGVSMFPDDGEDKETLIQNADKAMYYAKNNGKNNYKLYSLELEEMEVSNEGIVSKWLNILQNTKLFNQK